MSEERDPGKSAASSASNPEPATPLPMIDFSTFVMSLNASALVNLGVIPDPVTGKSDKNLPLGKQTIDIIGMLEDKTRGNLTPDEAKLIKGMLYDLRITYVRQSS
jgi:Domain of unknown function (DUF1844)